MSHNPPKIFLKFFRWFCHPRLKKPIEGDLMELYEERVKIDGKRKADLGFIKDVLLLFRPSIIKPADGTYRINNYGMLKNYFKVGIRNTLKYKMFSFINVFGLAVAMSVCMLIILMLADQQSSDQFHEKRDRIYRVLGKPFKGSVPYATTAYPTTNELKKEYPLFDQVVSLRFGVGGEVTFNQKNAEVRGFFTDNSFFDVFSFSLVEGNKTTALSKARTIVLTKEKAYQLFNTENPIGKHVQFTNKGLSILNPDSETDPVDWGLYTVVGVIDNENLKSHLTFDVLVSSSSLATLHEANLIDDLTQNWDMTTDSYGYVVLKEGISQRKLDHSLVDFAERKYADNEDLPEYTYFSQSITRITPGIVVSNEIKFRLPERAYWVLSFMAVIIMIMACVNYVNLSVARSLSRTREIGVRKVNGATRKNLVYQFLTESVITVMFSLFMAVFILSIIKEGFMNLWVIEHLDFNLNLSGPLYLLFFFFALVVGVLAGIYPALIISRREPVSALKSDASISSGKFGLQKVLNVSQFVVSLLFIVTSIVIYKQFKHYTAFEYGFDAKNVVNIPLQNNDYELLAHEFNTVGGVMKVSACEYVPATGTESSVDFVHPKTEEEHKELLFLSCNEQFLPNLELKMVAGKGLPAKGSGELDRYVVINEAATVKLGFANPQESIGEFFLDKSRKNMVEIIGVVENFRASLLIGGDEIRPLVLQNREESFKYLNVKISDVNPMETISNLEEKWETIGSGRTFEYDFYEDQLATTHKAVFDVASVIGYISFLAILISCLGLLGMAIYNTERRTKEIGIRKVLGAAEIKIVLGLSRGFLKLLIISIVIAAPLSYLFNTLWLNNFPNRVDFGIGSIILGSAVLLTLGLITIGSQTIRASRKNPVESLKYE